MTEYESAAELCWTDITDCLNYAPGEFWFWIFMAIFVAWTLGSD